jgi:hypothetical protein
MCISSNRRIAVWISSSSSCADWDCQHNNEPFWSALRETDLPAVLRQLDFAPTSIFEAQIHADVEDEMPKVASEVEDYGRGGMWYACGAEA